MYNKQGKAQIFFCMKSHKNGDVATQFCNSIKENCCRIDINFLILRWY